MTDALAVSEYWNATVLGDIANELLRATRDDQIYLSIEREQLRDIFPGSQQVHRAGRKIGKLAERTYR